MKKIPYDELHLLPYVIAETVCGRPYTGSEWSKGMVSPNEVAEIETKRQAMTQDDILRFCAGVDKRCLEAYTNEAKWFMRCVEAKGNIGRDGLYSFITHWLVGFLLKYWVPESPTSLT